MMRPTHPALGALSLVLFSLLAPSLAHSEADDTWFKERFAEIDRQKASKKPNRPASTTAEDATTLRESILRLIGAAEEKSTSRDCSECSAPSRRTQESLRPVQEISDNLTRQQSSLAQSSGWRPLAASSALRSWFYSDNTRGRNEKRQLLPQKDAAGNYKVMVCAGAGCPMKIPFVFSREMMERVRAVGARARQHRNCTQDNLRCEIIAAQEMGRQMEMLVVDLKLRKMGFEEMKKAYGSNEPLGGSFERNKQLDLDCVDQSANGSSYFLILKDMGLFRHAEVMSPGYMLPSHWFTRVLGDDGRQYRIDFYHRGRHGVLPGVVTL